MSVLNRTAPVHAAPAREITAPVNQPSPLLGGGYVTTSGVSTPSEGTYVSTRSARPVTVRGAYVTSLRRTPAGRTEGRYTDRG